MQYNSFTNQSNSFGNSAPTVPFNPKTIVTDNRIYITGTLVESNVSLIAEGALAKNGNKQKASIKGDFTIRCVTGKAEDGSDIVSDHKVELYKKKMTQADKENKGYAPLLILMDADSIGKRFSISAQYKDNKFLDSRTGVLIQNSKIKADFVNPAKNDAEDQAIATFGGFVYQGLIEKVNKDGVCYAKELQIMQTGDFYRGEPHINLVKFVVAPDDENATSIESIYTKGETIKITAELRSVTETKTVESTGRMFGTPEVKVYTNTLRSNYIIGGNEPIHAEGMTYSPDDIAFLVDIYDGEKATLMAKNDSGAKHPATGPGTSASRNLFG